MHTSRVLSTTASHVPPKDQVNERRPLSPCTAALIGNSRPMQTGKYPPTHMAAHARLAEPPPTPGLLHDAYKVLTR